MTTRRVDISRALSKIDRVSKRAETIPWYFIGQLMQNSIKLNFTVGGRVGNNTRGGGGPMRWTARKESYPWPILNKTGRLMNNNTVELIREGVRIANRNLAYNRAQNLGYPGGNLPKREFMVAQDADLLNIGNIIRSHVLG